MFVVFLARVHNFQAELLGSEPYVTFYFTGSEATLRLRSGEQDRQHCRAPLVVLLPFSFLFFLPADRR